MASHPLSRWTLPVPGARRTTATAAQKGGTRRRGPRNAVSPVDETTAAEAAAASLLAPATHVAHRQRGGSPRGSVAAAAFCPDGPDAAMASTTFTRPSDGWLRHFNQHRKGGVIATSLMLLLLLASILAAQRLWTGVGRPAAMGVPLWPSPGKAHLGLAQAAQAASKMMAVRARSGSGGSTFGTTGATSDSDDGGWDGGAEVRVAVIVPR